MMSKTVYSILLLFCVSAAQQGLGEKVYEKDGHLFLGTESGPVEQLTTGGNDRSPVMGPRGKQVVFIRKSQNPAPNPEDDPLDEARPGKRLADQLWLYDLTQKRERILVKDTQSDAEDDTKAIQNTVEMIKDSSLCFSTDGSRIYFIAEAWATSGALHVVDVKSRQRRYLASALYVEVIPSGEYQDDLVVQQHRYFPAGGSYDWYWRYNSEGRELGVLAESEEGLQGFRELYYRDRDKPLARPDLEPETAED